MFEKKNKEKEQMTTFGVQVNQYHPLTGKVIGTKDFYSDDAGQIAEWFDKNSFKKGKKKKGNKNPLKETKSKKEKG